MLSSSNCPEGPKSSKSCFKTVPVSQSTRRAVAFHLQYPSATRGGGIPIVTVSDDQSYGPRYITWLFQLQE